MHQIQLWIFSILQFGFDGLFFGRLDYQDKDKRLKNKTMESIWMGSSNLGTNIAIMQCHSVFI